MQVAGNNANMNETAAEMVERLLAESRLKLDLIEKVLDLSKKQEISLASGSYNSLLDQIRMKQELMDRIDGIDRDFYSSFMQLKSVLGIDSLEAVNTEIYPEILQLKSVVALIMERLSELQEMDTKNNGTVQEEIERVKTEMRSLNNQVRANKVYGTNRSSDSSGFFVDSKK